MTRFGDLVSRTGRFVALTADVTAENFSRFILPGGTASSQPSSLRRHIWEVYAFEVWLDDSSENFKQGVQIALAAVTDDWDKPHHIASGIQMSNQRIRYVGKLQVPYGLKFYIYAGGFVAGDIVKYTLLYRRVLRE